MPALQQGETWLIHLEYRVRADGCNSRMSWRVGGKWCKGKPTLSGAACPFSQSTISFSFVKSSDFSALTHLSLCSVWPARPLTPAPISPLSDRWAAWSPAPRRHFSTLYREIQWAGGSFAAVAVCWKPPTSGSIFQLDPCSSQPPAEF